MVVMDSETEYGTASRVSSFDEQVNRLMDEIKWNERRLANLVLSWEDQQQTMDLLVDLRAELHELTKEQRHAA